jgi:hypothetical protein
VQRHGQPVNVTVVVNGSDFYSVSTIADSGGYTVEELEHSSAYIINIFVAFGELISTSSSTVLGRTLGKHKI